MANLAQGWICHLPCQAKYQSNDAHVVDELSQTPSPLYSPHNVMPVRKRLESPTAFVRARNRKRSPSTQRRAKSRQNVPDDGPTEVDLAVSEMLSQPETRPIPQEQLAAEVKGIYAGLMMIESKCIEVDSPQNANDNLHSTKLNNEQWQALIVLHRALWHEHHDFFLASQHPSASPAPRRLASKYVMPARIWRHGIHSFLELLRHRLPASQHPSASPALRRLASKYAMPARMWRHGIHSFLELLRHRLPASLEHMLAFIYFAYSMIALLSETVPNFEDTWIPRNSLGRVSWRRAYSSYNLEAPSPCPEVWGQILSNLSSSPSPFSFAPHAHTTRVPETGLFSSFLRVGRRLHGPSWQRGYFKSLGSCSGPLDGLQSKGNTGDLTMPNYLLHPLYLLSVVPPKLLWLAILTAMAIPVVSIELPGRDIVTMAWTFGIMANVPSVYVLANPPVPSRVDHGGEEIFWKIARGWGLTFGPVFAAVLVVLLRAILPREKRVPFIALVFTMSLVVMLLLKLFMRDDTWSVLDLLALCVSFCGVAAYIITSGPRNTADGDLSCGHSQYPQANLAINQPAQPSQALQADDEAGDDSFIIGDDSTLGDAESRV